MNFSTASYRGILRFDPRTKILFTLTVGAFCLTMLGGSAPAASAVRGALTVVSFLLLAVSGRPRAALVFLVWLGVAYAAAEWLLPHVGGFLGWFIYATLGMTTQTLPSAIASYWLLFTTTAGELIAALQRARVPQAVTIPLAVMFRFFPTVVGEARQINDAMRMRGVHLGGGKASEMFEYRVVPMVTNSVKIADELSQAALTRGLGAAPTRTSIARIGFGWQDWLLAAGCAACFAALALPW
ncbi:energy-coupling factor transporter transmembrane component T [Bifidobacterium avesanii]|uniref:Energy-coupling factor transporter transmembrane protein EcfT n=1 Tax=Bifidobacterium avesanii TaxID=1798157 RepID=A0A7K3TJJ6_9BIFI|nr:energy-coupling factor transporter transmembrane component T [Bifidobacterium avesanii]KAB8290941.1 Cobalt transport protein [Bifidobacterium avesanii]NEG78899.1 energy-coupling factor transporter transmembrane protein EcfT [Bifidobacterium avesanii]